MPTRRATVPGSGTAEDVPTTMLSNWLAKPSCTKVTESRFVKTGVGGHAVAARTEGLQKEVVEIDAVEV